MIKHNPRLSFKDRYRLVKRVLKLALNKDSEYLNMLWKNPKGDVLTHTFYPEGTEEVTVFNDTYCSYITLEEIKYRVYQLKGFHIPS